MTSETTNSALQHESDETSDSTSDEEDENDSEIIVDWKDSGDAVDFSFSSKTELAMDSSEFDPSVSKILNELRDMSKDVCKNECHKCSKSFANPFQSFEAKEKFTLTNENIQTINDLDRSLCETIGRCNLKLYFNHIARTQNDLTALFTNEVKIEFDSWNIRLRDDLPQQINFLRVAFRDIRDRLIRSIRQTSELQSSIKEGKLQETLKLINAFGSTEDVRLMEVIRKCAIIFQKLEEYHSAVERTKRMVEETFRRIITRENVDMNFVLEHLKLMKNIRSKYFDENKSEYFSNWFNTSRTNLAFKKINEDLTEIIEIYDNPFVHYEK